MTYFELARIFIEENSIFDFIIETKYNDGDLP